MARLEGFEPPFSGIGIRCVIQLRHRRKYYLNLKATSNKHSFAFFVNKQNCNGGAFQSKSPAEILLDKFDYSHFSSVAAAWS